MRGLKRVNGARGRCSPFVLVLFEMLRHALHHREDSGVAWGPWLMDLRRDWLGGSAKHLRWSSAAFCPRADRQRQQAPSGPENDRSSGNATKRELSTVCARPKTVDDHRRCFAVPPSQSRRRSINHGPHATPSPNPRHGAGRDATKPAQEAGTPATGAIYPLYPSPTPH